MGGAWARARGREYEHQVLRERATGKLGRAGVGRRLLLNQQFTEPRLLSPYEISAPVLNCNKEDSGLVFRSKIQDLLVQVAVQYNLELVV